MEQVAGRLQGPHEAMVLARPHRSVVVSEPQGAPAREHNCSSVSPTHVQTFATHEACPEQLPQFTVRDRPHESAFVTTPQFFPNREQKVASLSQPHSPASPLPPQVSGKVQLQVGRRVTPQLSTRVTVPHRREAAQRAWSVSGTGPQVTVRIREQLSAAVTTPH